MTVVTTHYRYRRPPRKRQAAALVVPAVVTAADAVASGNRVPTPSPIVTVAASTCCSPPATRALPSCTMACWTTACNFIAKPFNLAALAAKVREVLAAPGGVAMMKVEG
jgi:hypothetical protein